MKMSSCLQVNGIVQGGRRESRRMLLPRRPFSIRSRFGYGPSLVKACLGDREPGAAGHATGYRGGEQLS